MLKSVILDGNSSIESFEYVVFLRPYLIQMLSNLYMAGNFDLGVFSIGQQAYVDAVIRVIE